MVVSTCCSPSQALLMAIIIGFICLAGIFIILDMVMIVGIAVLQSRHRGIAKKWGHRVKRYRHMYRVFSPWFMIK